jgi:hypothetical protein
MKVMFLLIIITAFQAFPQGNNTEIKESTKIFFETAARYSYKYFNKPVVRGEIPGSEIDSLAKKLYKAKAEDPVGFSRYVENAAPDTIRPGVQIGIIKRIIASEYGMNYSEIIDVPYFVRGEVIGIEKGYYEDLQNKLRIPQTILIVKVEDALKGNNYFKNNDTITIKYLNQWMSNCPAGFIAGKSYFFPFRPWNCQYNDCKELGLYTFNDNNCGVYLVEDETIYIPNNFFLLGNKSDWKLFRSHFIKQYLLE